MKAALAEQPQPQLCGPGGLQWLQQTERVLSKVVHDAVPFFKGHGSFGIFGESTLDKVRLFRSTVCEAGHKARTICELGFNAGHSALMFLLLAPKARVLSFDLGDIPWARWSAALLNATHGHRFTYIMGSSLATVPAYAAANPGTRCDVVFIDGAKDYAIRKADLKNFRRLADAGARLLFDEVCGEDCVRGQNRSKYCLTCWGGCSRAYAEAVRSGLVAIDKCVTPKVDGLTIESGGACSATYL